RSHGRNGRGRRSAPGLTKRTARFDNLQTDCSHSQAAAAMAWQHVDEEGPSMRAPVAPLRRRRALVAFGALAALGPTVSGPANLAGTLQPLVSDFDLVTTGTTPPTEAQCFARRPARRCFNPTSMQASYNLKPLYANHLDG